MDISIANVSVCSPDGEPIQRRALQDIPLVAEHCVPSALALHRDYEQAIRRRDAGRAPSSTVEALMHSLRERRLAALTEPDTRRRLADLSDEQVIEVGGRLQQLKPHIARAWSDQEIAELFITRKK